LRKFQADQIITASSYLAGSAGEWRVLAQGIDQGSIAPHHLSQDSKAQFLFAIRCIKEIAEGLSLVATKAAAGRAFDISLEILSPDRRFGSFELRKLVSQAELVVHPLRDELETIFFLSLDAKHSAFYSSDSIFGQNVDKAFPSASFEIRDAGKCRALGCWTASVVHLMRAVETALNSLAKHLNVTPDQNWNKALDQIDAKLKEVTKSKDGATAEQWASEASAHLRAIKNAWRNHAAHGKARYEEGEAVAIFENVRFLLSTLAKRIVE
jgi:hypothetical protein